MSKTKSINNKSISLEKRPQISTKPEEVKLNKIKVQATKAIDKPSKQTEFPRLPAISLSLAQELLKVGDVESSVNLAFQHWAWRKYSKTKHVTHEMKLAAREWVSENFHPGTKKDIVAQIEYLKEHLLFLQKALKSLDKKDVKVKKWMSQFQNYLEVKNNDIKDVAAIDIEALSKEPTQSNNAEVDNIEPIKPNKVKVDNVKPKSLKTTKK